MKNWQANQGETDLDGLLAQNAPMTVWRSVDPTVAGSIAMESVVSQLQNSATDTRVSELEEKVRSKTESVLEKYLETDSHYLLLHPNYHHAFVRSILETAVFIGVNGAANPYRSEERNGRKHIVTPEQADANYASWLGKKLNLSTEEIEAQGLEKIEAMAKQYLGYAIEHVRFYLDNVIPAGSRQVFKSQYFDRFHDPSKIFSARELLVFYYELEREKGRYELAGKKGGYHPDAVENCRIAQFEIQRLLALSYLYRELEQNHKYQHLNEDTDFIIRKFQELFSASKTRQSESCLPFQTNNPFYHHTETKRLFWKKHPDGSYDTSGDSFEGASVAKIETITIAGRVRDHMSHNREVPVVHLALRSSKDLMSTVDKFIRKRLSTFDEVLDQRGVIFVLENFERDSEMLIKILENELSTLRSSWVEYPERMSAIAGNENSSQAYNVLKGVLKIPYKGKLLKQWISQASDELAALRERLKDDPEGLKSLRIVEESLGIFSSNFEDIRYNLLLEVQVFDPQSYISAELDETAAAYHDSYKLRQRMQNFPLYFPKEIYGEDHLRSVMWKHIESKIRSDLKGE